MVGKREKKRDGKNPVRLPGILLLLAAAAVLLTSGGPSGVAADSPVEVRAAAEVAPLPAPPAEMPAGPEAPARQEGPERAGPVVESGPVEDTYFDDAVFLGDSRTEGFSLYSGLETGTYFHAVGATVESVFTKAVETEYGKLPLLDAMAGVDCGKVYVMLGVNELGWSKVETFHDQYAKVIDRLREDHPGAEIVLQSIIPVSARQEAKGSYVNNARIAVYNEAIQELAAEKGCPYLNVAEAVTDESGCLREDWNFDGVHLNVAGCRAWLEYLRTHAVGEGSGETPESSGPAEP